jgi:hypothetical protein
MCPSCARLVGRSDRACVCGADLRRDKPRRVKGEGKSPAQWLLSPWALYLLGTAGFLVFAFVARGQPTLGRPYLRVIEGWAMLGVGAIYLIKLREGLEEFLDYRPLCWWHDDPADGYFLAILLSSMQAVALLWFLVAPSLPKGTMIWP